MRRHAGAVSTPDASSAAAGLRAGFDRAATALSSVLDVEQGPVADSLAALGAEMAQPPRARWWPRRRQSRGIYLHGPVGAGKMWLVDVLLDQLPQGAYRRVHVYAAARALHAGIAARSGQWGALDAAIDEVIGGARLASTSCTPTTRATR